MLGRVMNVQRFRHAPSLLRLDGFVERGYIMCIQIIHHQPDLNGVGIPLVKHMLDLLRPVLPGAAFRDCNMTLTGQWLHFHEDFSHAVPDIFVVHPHRLPRLAGYWRVNFADQLLAGFVHTYHRIIGVVRQMINFQDILHRGYKCRVPLRRNLPVFAEVRLKFVFFKTRCTVMCETEGANSSSTALSASNLTVQRSYPSGAAEHARAIRRASKAPSKITSRGGLSRGLRPKAASRP